MRNAKDVILFTQNGSRFIKDDCKKDSKTINKNENDEKSHFIIVSRSFVALQLFKGERPLSTTPKSRRKHC
jgi:hypothetical protein